MVYSLTLRICRAEARDKGLSDCPSSQGSRDKKLANPRKQLPFLNGVFENNYVFQKRAGKTVAEIGGEKAEIGGQIAEKSGIAFFGPQTIPFFVEGHLLEMPFFAETGFATELLAILSRLALPVCKVGLAENLAPVHRLNFGSGRSLHLATQGHVNDLLGHRLRLLRHACQGMRTGKYASEQPSLHQERARGQ